MNNDRKILEAINAKNHQKMLQLMYETVQPKVVSYVLKNHGDHEQAQDVFQDAVMNFYRKVKTGSFEMTTSIEGYVFMTAKNLWINKAKRDARIHYVDDYVENGSQETILSSFITKEREEQIKRVLGKLGERCYQLLHYVFYQNYSLAEVTELMGFSSTEVTHTNHYRCKQKLKKMVKGDDSFKHLLQNATHG